MEVFYRQDHLLGGIVVKAQFLVLLYHPVASFLESDVIIDRRERPISLFIYNSILIVVHCHQAVAIMECISIGVVIVEEAFLKGSLSLVVDKEQGVLVFHAGQAITEYPCLAELWLDDHLSCELVEVTSFAFGRKAYQAVSIYALLNPVHIFDERFACMGIFHLFLGLIVHDLAAYPLLVDKVNPFVGVSSVVIIVYLP